jgi:nitrogenase-stabilizing/protective protein
MTTNEFDQELAELEGAEAFLDYFGIGYRPEVVQVNRLHILQRFHNYLGEAGAPPAEPQARRDHYAGLLAAAYHDFEVSDARTEKVFRVFRMHEPRSVAVSLSDLMGSVPRAAGV